MTFDLIPDSDLFGGGITLTFVIHALRYPTRLVLRWLRLPTFGRVDPHPHYGGFTGAPFDCGCYVYIPVGRPYRWLPYVAGCCWVR